MAQRHRDPLTQPEIDQIRDASWEPQQRLTLYVKFARARLVSSGADAQRSQRPRTGPSRPTTCWTISCCIYDELNDNIDTYIDRKDDIRKPLKLVIDADTEFQAKLRALKDAADVPAEEVASTSLFSPMPLDTVDTSAEDHRKTPDGSGRCGQAQETATPRGQQGRQAGIEN